MSNESKSTSDTPQGEGTTHRKGYTPPKGRPTPKRIDQEIAKGVRRDPNGASDAQRYQHRKELKKSMTKEEWKEYKKKEREASREANRLAQERMNAGDERYLMPRDKGEVRRYVRDWIDSRSFLNEWVMPFMLVLLVILFIGTYNPSFANISTIVALVVVVIFAIEAFWLGRKVNNAVRLKFPGTTEAGWSLAFYAYSRASQPRKWRTPKARVERGAAID
ncbi:DUF3043 domain-containing protein [uncultured Corynebacterium sp.]|uniref:DUF3043 domain-containing protein n=1 Tax=uncultured Corynebacterium sp. TaxID=159447 RepID=UPI0025D9A4F8|nr:DUF3043 domain-containing protein [uncultured Corynebacterium sp.]